MYNREHFLFWNNNNSCLINEKYGIPESKQTYGKSGAYPGRDINFGALEQRWKILPLPCYPHPSHEALVKHFILTLKTCQNMMKTCQEYLFTCTTNLDAHPRNHNKFTEVVVYIYFVTWMVSKGESKTASPGVGLQVSGRAACGIILIKRVDAILEDVSVAEIIVWCILLS